MKKKIMLIALVLFLCDLSARPAHAYIDLGSGSYALQIALAGVAGAAYALRGFWLRIFSFFRRKTK